MKNSPTPVSEKKEALPELKETDIESAPQIGPLDHGRHSPADAGVRAPAAIDEEGGV